MRRLGLLGLVLLLGACEVRRVSDKPAASAPSSAPRAASPPWAARFVPLSSWQPSR